jgi:uncharacterized membrane protein
MMSTISLLSKQDNVTEATFSFVRKLGVKITRTAITNKIRNHIDYPSLNAVSDTLNSFNLTNYAVKINVETLPEVPTPCIAALNIDGGIFAVINDIKDDFVEWYHTTNGKQYETITSFAEKWQGVLLLAQANEKSGEINYFENKRKEMFTYLGRLLLYGNIITVFITIIFLSVIKSGILPLSLFFIIGIKLLGVVITMLLLWQLLDSQNPLLKKVCKIGKSANCNSVLNSKVATIGGVLSWSEIGFFYFTGSFLALLIGLPNITILYLTAFLNLLSLPYTIFSIYYQGIVIKKWCVLCLIVQFLLLSEFILFYFLNNGLPSLILPNLRNVCLLFTAFVLPIVVWFILKPIIQLALQTDDLKTTLKRLKNDTVIFQHLLLKQPRMFNFMPNMEIIEFGNVDAKNVVTVVTNPYCHLCAEKHTLMRDLIEQNKKTLKCQIVFVISNASNDIRTDFFKHLLSLPHDLQIKALDFWFSMKEKDYTQWSIYFPVDRIEENYSKMINIHEYWCMKSNIQVTPTIFINGYQLPDVYNIEDIQRIAPYIFN